MDRSKWDKDLRDGHAREDAFVHVLLRSRVEHKRDRRATEFENGKAPTGNICVEYAQSDGNGGLKPSGIAVTEAGWWAIEYRAEHWLLIPTEALKALARRARAEGRTRPTGDNGNRSVLVPLSWVVEPTAAAEWSEAA